MDKVVEIIWEAAKYLCGCAKQQVDYIGDLEDNLRLLDKKWKDLQDIEEDVKANVDEEMRGAQLNTWLQRIQAIRKEIEDIQVQGVQEIQNKCICECCSKNCVSSYKLGKKVVEMLQDVDELVTKRESFNVEIGHNVLPSKSTEFPLDDETVGLDLMLEKVWNSIEAENVGVIGLYGMGGAGKTTLLKRINNEIGTRRPDFNVVMWLVVSKEPNLDSIMDNIRKKIGIGDKIWDDCSNRDEKAAKIYKVLKQKKFVLLLDDIWEHVDFKIVGVPHPKGTNFQSKVLFTTRSEDVCAKMHAQRKFKVECLTEKEALELFFMKVGEETLNSHPNIPKLAEELATECKGLPLALIVLGSTMAGVTSMEAWKDVRNHLTSSSWTALELETKVFSILKFSYDRLPNETHKKCFLYCALYPEDYEIQVLDLIDKWIAEGFLGKDATIQDLSGHGESVIEKLKQSCLLERVEDDLFMSHTVKLHDVIRDLALWLARDQDKNRKRILVEGDTLAVSQNDVETWKIVERISIMQHNKFHFPTVACPNLTTLILRSKEYEGIKTYLPNIQYMSQLKVLDLSFNLAKLPPEIGYLVLLEYITLSCDHMKVSGFPIELKNLKNLKFFSLQTRYCADLLIVLLEVISSLKQLRVLRFTNRQHLRKVEINEKEFLEQLESQQNLETLWITIRTENGLNKLLEPTKLQSCIYSLTLQEIDTPTSMRSLLVSMSRMKHLHEIWFEELEIVEDSSFFDTCYLSMLRKVYIGYCYSLVHLTWLKYAPLLQDLQIYSCKSLKEVIKEGTEDKENVDNIFPSLVKLYLVDLPRLKSIHKKALPFPSLKFVQVIGCKNLIKLPFGCNTAMQKIRKIRGNESWCCNLEWEDPAIERQFLSVFETNKTAP